MAIDSIAADAVKSQYEAGVPASVTIAQAILESGWGSSELSSIYYNYFGIKGVEPAGSVSLPTTDYIKGVKTTIYDQFRKYENAEELFIDHGHFFLDNSRCGEALQHTDDPRRFAQEIAKAGYATDPNCANLLIFLIDKYNFAQFG